MSKEKTIDGGSGWETPVETHDFFGSASQVEDVITAIEKNDVEEITGTVETDKKPKPVELDEDEQHQKLVDEQFSDFSTPPSLDEDEEDDKKSKKTPIAKSSISTLEFLKEKGFVDYELQEGEELTEEKANELVEDSWESSIEAGVEDIIKELPAELKELIKYSAKGGDVGTLLTKMATSGASGLTKASDISKEDTQVLAVTMDLKAQGYDQDYIDTQIEFLKSSEKLGAISKKAYDKIIASQEAETQAEVARVAKAREDRKKEARTYKTNITTHIDSLTEVKGLPLSKADKLVLPTYISDPTVEMENGKVVSEFQADLFKVLADKDKVTLLAKLIKSDFDFSSISRKKETESARTIREKIQNSDKKSINNSAGVHKASKKAIWDMLD